MTHACRADLHVHSHHSDTPSSRLLRAVGCPESFTSPQAVYEAAHRRGMDLVTITDHNSISGALEIAHLPGTFLSVELSTSLPETGCRLHVVALGISERQFPDLLAAREDVYELVALLRAEGIVHFIAHPLFDFDRRLDADTVEKLLLLFDVFEARNGARAECYNEAVVGLLGSLSPETMERLAAKHGIEPQGPTPWLKAMVGGSDDHGGFFIAHAYTVAESCAGPEDLLTAVRERRTVPGGEHGDPLTLAHNLWGIGYHYAEERLGFDRRNGYLAFFNTLLEDLLPGSTGDPSELERARLTGELSFADVAAILQAQIAAGTLQLGPRLPQSSLVGETADGQTGASPAAHRRTGTRLLYSGGFRDFARFFARELDREAQLLLGDEDFLRQSQTERADRRVFAATSRLADRMIYRSATRAFAVLGGADPEQPASYCSAPLALGHRLRRGVSHLGAVAMVHFLALPYYYGYHSQNRSKELLDELARRFSGSGGAGRVKVAVFVDVLDGGEDAAVERIRRAAAVAGAELVVITAEIEETPAAPRGRDVQPFAVVGAVTLPGLHGLTLALPPVLQVVDFVDREGFTAVHALTPGSMGLLARLASRLLHLPLSAEYGAALPLAVRRHTADGLREELAWRYLARFCRAADEIVVSGAADDEDVLLRRLARGEIPLGKVQARPSWLTSGGAGGSPPRTPGERLKTPGSRSSRR
jgi:hypothetical protein